MQPGPRREVNDDSTAEPPPLPNWPAILDEVEMLHPVVRILLRYRELIRVAIYGAGIYSLLMGLNTWIAGDVRFSGPSYATAVDFAQVVGALMAALPVADITIEDAPLEEIIAAIYRDQRAQISAG